MGRRAKNPEKNAEDFTVDKEQQLEVFKKEKILITQEIIDMFDIKPVGRTCKLGGQSIAPFVGNTYKQSLEMAYEWMNRTNMNNKKQTIELVAYFPQEHQGKSILVSYNKTIINEGELT